MNRQEILERAQREEQDEGMTHAENQGRKFALLIMTVVYAVVLIINLIYDKTDYNCIPLALYFATLMGEGYARFRFTRKKSTLIWTILTAVIVVVELASYISMVRS